MQIGRIQFGNTNRKIQVEKINIGKDKTEKTSLNIQVPPKKQNREIQAGKIQDGNIQIGNYKSENTGRKNTNRKITHRKVQIGKDKLKIQIEKCKSNMFKICLKLPAFASSDA